MTHDEARKLLDAFANAETQMREFGESIADSTGLRERCLEAMTQPAAKIAEQQREIARLQIQIGTARAWLKNVAEHTRECEHNRWDQPLCTCGLDEVLR